jgi:hypothetical protein
MPTRERRTGKDEEVAHGREGAESHRRWWAAILAGSLLILAPGMQKSAAQEVPCSETPVVSVPFRPTVSTATDTTKCGIVEFDSGGQRTWPGDGSRQEAFLFGLRMGLTHNLDLHWRGGSYLHFVGSDDSARDGFGENWVGVKYRFLEQTKERPALGVFYNVKIPGEADADPFATGTSDQALSLLFSKDIRTIHFDFNLTPQLAGRQGAAGHDYNTGFALAGFVPLRRHFTFVGEGYGASFLNPASPAFASLMAGLTYQVNPRWVLDAGSDWGLTAAAPAHRLYGGITIAMANAFGLFRPRRNQQAATQSH